jgi:hypothetical protein
MLLNLKDHMFYIAKILRPLYALSETTTQREDDRALRRLLRDVSSAGESGDQMFRGSTCANYMVRRTDLEAI